MFCLCICRLGSITTNQRQVGCSQLMGSLLTSLISFFWRGQWRCVSNLQSMHWTLNDCLKKMPGKRGKWVQDWPGQVSVCVCVHTVIPLQNVLCLSLQMLITASQMQWTTDVTRALMTSKERADKAAVKSLKKKQVRTA